MIWKLARTTFRIDTASPWLGTPAVATGQASKPVAATQISDNFKCWPRAVTRLLFPSKGSTRGDSEEATLSGNSLENAPGFSWLRELGCLA